jgi:hypothetical protein
MDLGPPPLRRPTRETKAAIKELRRLGIGRSKNTSRRDA